MTLRCAVGLLALLETTSAYLQLDFKKERCSLSQIPPRSRQRYLQRRDGTVSAALDNAQNNQLYLVNVTIGDPPQDMALQLDTGSSDTWVPDASSDVCQGMCSNGAFQPDSSKSFREDDSDFTIEYVDGTSILGSYFTDTIGVGGATIERQMMGLAKNATIVDPDAPFQGIIGVGFASGEAIVSDYGDQYPNIINTLKSQGHTTTMAYSLWLNDLEAATGSILFGGVDESRYEGDLTILPIQPDEDSGELTSFTVVLDNLDVESGSGKVQYRRTSLAMPVILDSGTTLTFLPDDIANDIATGVGAGNAGDGWWVPCELTNSPATFSFGFGSPNGPKIRIQISEFVLPLPPSQDGGSQADVCQWGILGSGNSPNLFGDTFLRSAYVVYDLQYNNVGIAQTKFNVSDSESNVQEIRGSQLPGASSTASGAVVTQTFSGHPNDPSQIGSATGDIGSGGTATFDLSGSKTESAAPSHSSSAAFARTAPSRSMLGLGAFGFVVLSGIFGVLMVVL